MRIICLTGLVLLFVQASSAQIDSKALERLLQVPRHYSIIKTADKIQIDGRDNEAAWEKAPWTELFTDIEANKENVFPYTTRCKMLWDDEFLYIFAKIEEPHISATMTMQDQPVFHDNAFEIFIDTHGDLHNYFELQINANSAVWDLFMTKPYRSGGVAVSGWESKGLKKGIYIDGTINNPADTDRFWSVELAIPLKSLNNAKASVGTIWRMNLSRVQWDMDINNGIYEKKKDSAGKPGKAHYTVWSPQGIVNLHYPERWGYVRFINEGEPRQDFLDTETEKLKLILWKYFYLQQEFKNKYGKYAKDHQQIKEVFSDLSLPDIPELKMTGTEFQFIIQLEYPDLKNVFTLDHEGKFYYIKDKKPAP